MLVLIKQAGGRSIECYRRPRTVKGYKFLEEQRKRLYVGHSYYYVWDTVTKDDANIYRLAEDLKIKVEEFYN